MIEISRTLNNEIEKLIQDDAVKQEFGYSSIQNFVVEAIEGAIEGAIEADKDIVLITD